MYFPQCMDFIPEGLNTIGPGWIFSLSSPNAKEIRRIFCKLYILGNPLHLLDDIFPDYGKYPNIFKVLLLQSAELIFNKRVIFFSQFFLRIYEP